jgi:hypothetical protein
MSTDTTIYAYVTDTIEAVPPRHGDLSSVVKRGRSIRRRKRTVLAAGSVVGMCLAVLPLLLTLGSSPSPIGEYGGESEFMFATGFRVAVIGEPIESEGALVFAGAPAEPANARFDLARLGTEYPIDRRNAADLVVPPPGDPFESNALHASTLVYLGDAGGAQLALQETDGETCVFLGNGTEVTGGGFCGITDAPTIGYSADPQFPQSRGGWLVWSMLPTDTSVVTVTLPNGDTFWQRPVSRTAFFAIVSLDTLQDATATAFDSSGAVIATRAPGLLAGHGYFLNDHQVPETSGN